MLINFLQFLANLIIALALLRVLEAKVLESNPDSAFGQALAFVV